MEQRTIKDFMVPGGMFDGIVAANLDPNRNDAVLVRNAEFDLKGAVRSRRGCLRIAQLAEVANPTNAPTLAIV